MIVKVDNYNSTTVSNMISELSADPEIINWMLSNNKTTDNLEAIALHLIQTDSDYNTDSSVIFS